MKDIKACIFNIQKYSIHDGPGIRTVVFFKGCPLQCLWCSNPESQNSNAQITWDKSKCAKCLHCVDNCENKAISFDNGKIVIDPYPKSKTYQLEIGNIFNDTQEEIIRQFSKDEENLNGHRHHLNKHNKKIT